MKVHIIGSQQVIDDPKEKDSAQALKAFLEFVSSDEKGSGFLMVNGRLIEVIKHDERTTRTSYPPANG